MGFQEYPMPSAALNPNDNLAFIRFKHSQALSWLSNSKLAAPSPLENMDLKRSAAKLTLERLGYTWPAILDATSPLASPASADTLDYESVTIECEHSLVIGLVVLIMLIAAKRISRF